jgi:2-haloacid dehalogenase
MASIKNIVFDLYGVLINPSDNYGILDTVDIMRELKDSGYRVFGMTNLSLEGYSTVLTQCPFVRLLEDVIVSGREGVSKPHPRIYQILLERHNLLPEEILFVDDAAVNVETAQSLHMHGHVFKTPRAFEAHLIKLGFFNDLPEQSSDCCSKGQCSCH